MDFDDLYNKLIDSTLDRQEPPGNPAKILICTTPRTAGHSYCQVLRQFGLGIPTEYFQWQYALPLMRRWSGDGVMDLDGLYRHAAAYGRHLLEKRSVDGIFSAKIFHNNLSFACHSIGDDGPRSFYVFLSRRDKIEQTISLLSMLHTGQPFDGPKTLPGAPTLGTLSEKIVNGTVRHIVNAELGWKTYLATVDSSRIAHVAYEDFIADPSGTVRATMSNWFATSDPLPNIEAETKRYAHDVELKTIIGRQFGSQIRRLWRDMPDS
jgi:LPS sulfotransferase NodH